MSPNTPTQAAAAPPPTPARAFPLHWAALCLVILALAGFAAAPLYSTLRPTRDVRVHAALPPLASPVTPVANTEPDAPAAKPTRLVQAPGWLEPDPYYTAVSALADGVVQSIHALEGESVEEGQLLAQLVADDAKLSLLQAKGQLATAQAQLKIAEAVHTAATTDWEQPVERERHVAAAAAALAEAKGELEQLPALVAQETADLARWEEEFARINEAAAGGAVTERELIVARQQVASAKASLTATERREPILAAKVKRLAAEHRAAVRGAELRVEEREDLDHAAAAITDAQGGVQRAEAALAEAQLRLSRMTITAPMDGRVLKRLKAPGDKVMLGMDNPHSSHILHLYDPAKIQVRVDVPLADAAEVRVGQTCEVVVDVLPETTFRGEVTRITHEADLQKNTLQVKVRVIDPSPLLRPEMLTRVRFLPFTEGQAQSEPARPAASAPVVTTPETLTVRVPEACLDQDQVWVVRDRRGLRGVAKASPVQVIARDDNFVTIAGELHPGDLLIELQANTPLQDGERVRVATSVGDAA